MNKLLIPLLLAVVALGYFFAPHLLQQDQASEAHVVTVPSSCNFDTAPCNIVLPGNVALVVTVEGEAKPLSPFTVSISGADLLAASVDFEMLGMDMGINQYRMAPDDLGRWRTVAMLPVCTTGRSDWVAHLKLSFGNGGRYVIDYPFVVVVAEPR